MKIGTFRSSDGVAALGVVLGDGPSLRVLDARALKRRAPDRLPPGADVPSLIGGGARALQDLRAAVEWAGREGEDGWFLDERNVDWQVPLPVRNCIAAGRNFGKHSTEGIAYLEEHGMGTGIEVEVPSAFAKLASSMIPTRRSVAIPAGVREFDYEIEIAAVIGGKLDCCSESRALAGVFGYTILNDLSAREWQRQEMKNRMILLGKNFPGSGPLGPWIVTADEVPDPSVFSLELKINGETRQAATCDDMIHSFATLIAHWSRMGLDACDLVTSGTPGGVAVARKPDPSPFFLKSGDRIEASVDRIGVLETQIA